MNKYWEYLKYILRHKYYVMIECFKKGEYLRGLTHDNSKFRPDEFIPYAKYFYGDYGDQEHLSPLELSYYGIETKEEREDAFDLAWLKHLHRNDHHWQFWLLREDDGGIKKLRMPNECISEMLADWNGAGMAISGKNDTKEWYEKNRGKMSLNKTVRDIVKSAL